LNGTRSGTQKKGFLSEEKIPTSSEKKKNLSKTKENIRKKRVYPKEVSTWWKKRGGGKREQVYEKKKAPKKGPLVRNLTAKPRRDQPLHEGRKKEILRKERKMTATV